MKFLATLLLLLSMRSEANECAQDTKKYCAGVEPGRNQIAKCLEDYETRLSPACSKSLKEFNKKTAAKNPCYQDLADFCVDIPSDPQKLSYCLLKHESRLGPSCSADFKKKKSNFIVKDVCAVDVVNTCYGAITEPEGAVNRCLIKNKAKLSRFCQNRIDKKIAEMRKTNPCFDETEKYCPTQVRFVEIQACMEKKVNVLTPNCKKSVQEETNKAKANPCYVDLRKHCRPGITATEQHRCLQLNETELSNSCRQFRVTESQKLNKMVEMCEKDRLSLCAKAPFQDGMVLRCLKENISKVSPGCKSLL